MHNVELNNKDLFINVLHVVTQSHVPSSLLYTGISLQGFNRIEPSGHFYCFMSDIAEMLLPWNRIATQIPIWAPENKNFSFS